MSTSIALARGYDDNTEGPEECGKRGTPKNKLALLATCKIPFDSDLDQLGDTDN